MGSHREETDRLHGSRGFSMVELLFAAVIVPVILGVGVMTLRSSTTVSNDVIGSAVSVDKLRGTLRRIGDELVCSSVVGEDLNNNNVLDPGEDVNGNGRLEDDWAVTATSVRFNRVLADGTYSLPITYSLVNGRLQRSELMAGGNTVTGAVAGRVLAFSVLASAPQLTVGLSVGASTAPQSSSITVRQRN